MGESRSVNQFAGKIVAGGAAIGAANSKAVRAAALAAKETSLTAGRADTGGDLRLSRWRSGKGIKIGVGFVVKTLASEMAVADVTPRPAGVWRLLEYGAAPHSIVPGSTRRRKRAGATLQADIAGPVLPVGAMADARTKRGKAKVLSFGPGQVAAYVTHPGAPGKNTWSKGVEAARPVAVRVYAQTHEAALKAAFR